MTVSVSSRAFHNSSEMPLSWRPSEKALTLRQNSYELSCSWTVEIAERIRHTTSYVSLASGVGEDCADLFIEKTLFLCLWPEVTTRYVRELAWKNLGPEECRDSIVPVADPDLCVILNGLHLEGFRFVVRGGLPGRIIRWIGGIEGYIRDLLIFSMREAPSRDAGLQPERIGLEMVEGLPDGQTRSELFWWDGEVPEGKNISCLLFQQLPPEQKPLLDIFRSKGVRFMRLPFRVSDSDYDSLPLVKPPSGTPCPFSSFLHPGPERWLARRASCWLHMAKWWESFFIRHRIKIWISEQEGSLDTIAQRVAMDRLGGATISRQRSEYVGYSDTVGYQPAHVALTWNRHMAAYQEERRNRNDAVIPVGHTFGACPDRRFPVSDDYKAAMRDAGCRFVVAFFDNMAGLNREISFDQMQAFLGAMLAWAAGKPDAGILWKRKHDHAFKISRTPEYEILNRSGRIVFVQGPRRILPLTVAMAADVSVGVNISSAVFEPLIAGRRGLMYYPSSSGHHPLEKSATGRIVFNDAASLVRALEAIYRGEGGELGLIGAMRGLIDEYGDGKGPERMSGLVNRLRQTDPAAMREFLEKLRSTAHAAVEKGIAS